MPIELLRPLVWMDYRLAILLIAIVPLTLLIWALFKRVESIQRLLFIYWRVALLVPITIYLAIASWPISFVTGAIARILIPICLWFWVDINEEIEDLGSRPIKLALTAWRWAVSVYCVLGAVSMIPFLPCAFTAGAIKQPFCQVWLEAPWKFMETFHRNSDPRSLGFVGLLGLIIYLFYLSYFVVIRLGKQGRLAIPQ
ncbi:MAG: DUF3177 family protein [Cyanosarcina radialis HA8281-LM2]|nr:DUF3177 family protein [Cyanosarcina radialis HA8281-LM2]